MEKLPKDVVSLIFLHSDTSDILNMSLSGKKYNNILCKNQMFWMNKLRNDYGKFGHVPLVIKKDDMSWKQYYKILFTMSTKYSDIENAVYSWLNVYSYERSDMDNKKIRILLNDSRITSKTVNRFMKYSSYYGYSNIIKILLKDERTNPSLDDNYPIRIAASHGHVKVIELLLKDKRVNPSAYYNEPIEEASPKGHIDIAKLLLEDQRVNPFIRALGWAVQKGHIEIVKLILADKRMADYPIDYINYILVKEIDRAKFYGHTDVVNILKNIYNKILYG